METHKINHHEKTTRPHKLGLNGTGEETDALVLARQVIEEQQQPEQLSLLARIVMDTLGLTTEEARQMANDLGFSKY